MEITSQRQLFAFLRIVRKPISFISGLPVDTNSAVTYAHVWPKGSHPELKLFFFSIVFLTFQEHRLFDQGTAEERAKYAERTGANWAKLDERKEKLREYLQSKKAGY